MDRLAHPGHAGQPTDPPEPLGRKPRADAFKLTREEAQRVRTATRKIATTCGGFVALSVKLGVSTSIVYHAANPKRRPSLAFAVRLAGVAKVPVEALLTGKLAVAPAVIGVAA
jgi:hypothetical protein